MVASGLAWLGWRVATRGVYALPTESDRIVEPVALAHGPANLLIPGLRDAVVVVPDRPHDPRDAIDPAARAAMKRRRAFSVDSNQERLRGRAEVEQAPRPRVLVLGDSVPFGWGVDWARCLPVRLGQALDAPVLVGGVPGMRPDQLEHWAEHLLRRAQVDLVLVIQRPRQDELPTLGRVVRRIRGITGARVAAVFSPVSTFDVRGGDSVGPLLAAARAQLPDLPMLEATDGLRAALPRRGVVLRREGGRQRVVDLESGAVRVEAPDHPDRTDPAVYAALEEDPDLREAGFFDGGHVDEEGSERFAGVLADFVRQQGLWPPPA
ncbi:hypothetical protein L6R53_07410 [Myxococcota bacterium]|nr:hypothetical protein [Myxococcota bacterium]